MKLRRLGIAATFHVYDFFISKIVSYLLRCFSFLFGNYPVSFTSKTFSKIHSGTRPFLPCGTPVTDLARLNPPTPRHQVEYLYVLQASSRFQSTEVPRYVFKKTF
ncbi:hypothetical protein Glove_120g155 [Diversispora epigaea]|uniref:Uncharacterized protein n=1 Tax=Diversispora epigaea TaxID=1348612 RepID=A0A397J3K5_9GLOM|nr:hypothetical protein Glove_120g155 [Diversispora epigaea]